MREDQPYDAEQSINSLWRDISAIKGAMPRQLGEKIREVYEADWESPGMFADAGEINCRIDMDQGERELDVETPRLLFFRFQNVERAVLSFVTDEHLAFFGFFRRGERWSPDMVFSSMDFNGEVNFYGFPDTETSNFDKWREWAEGAMACGLKGRELLADENVRVRGENHRFYLSYDDVMIDPLDFCEGGANIPENLL